MEEKEKGFVETIFGWLDNLLKTVSNSLLALFQNWTTLAAPLFPAIMFGFNIYRTSIDSGITPNVAFWMSFTAAFALEGTGMVVLDGFVKLWSKNDQRVWFQGIGVFIYFAAGIATGFLENMSTSNRFMVMTILAFVITGAAYFSKAFQRTIEREEKEENFRKLTEHKREQEEWKLAQEQRKLSAAHRRELAKEKLELSAKVSSMPQQVSGNFPKLSETFPTDWRKLSLEQRQKIWQNGWDANQIANNVGISVRGAQNWVTRLEEEFGQ